MNLKIEIDITDDRRYRESTHPYNLHLTELSVDVEDAVTSTLHAMQIVDMREATCPVKNHDEPVGTIRVVLS